MKKIWKLRIWTIGVVLLMVLSLYGGYRLEKWMDFEDRWKHDVEGVLWRETGGGLSATGWAIADMDDLQIDEEGKYYYPVDIHVDRLYPGEEIRSGGPKTSVWLPPGREARDYEIGDYYEGRLQKYSSDPGPSMRGLIFAFIPFMLCVGLLGRVWIMRSDLTSRSRSLNDDNCDEEDDGDNHK